MFVTMEQAAELEGIKYNTMIRRVQRNPKVYEVKRLEQENGGKPKVLIELSGLSKQARRKHKEIESIGENVLVDNRTNDEELPWYVLVDFDQYVRKHSKHYYKAVEYAKHIENCVNYEGEPKQKTAFINEYAQSIGSSGRSLQRHIKEYITASAWSIKMSKVDGNNYDFLKILALARKPKEKNTFPKLSDEAKQLIASIWFDKDFASNRPTYQMVFDKVKIVSDSLGWDCPSYGTVARYIHYLMDEQRLKNAHFLVANGTRSYKNKVMVKGSRDTKALAVMEMVQGDEHTFDLWVKYTHPNGKVTAIKPRLVSWIDTRTRVIVSSIICVKANAQILKKSLYNMIYTFGCPKYILIDNGKDYTAEEMTGRKRNKRFTLDNETVGFYRGIGIQDDTRSLPYQPWSKSQQERFYGTVCERFSKWFMSYTGTLTGSKTAAKVEKDIKGLLESDELMSLDEFYDNWLKWLESDYHYKVHGGLKKAGEQWTKPRELFDNAENKYYKAPPPKSYATLLMMKSERVHVYQTGIKRFGHEYRSDDLVDYIGEKVDIYYDEDDVTRLYVYTRNGDKICEAVSQELLQIAPKVSSEVLTKHMKMQKRQLRNDRQKLLDVTDGKTFEDIIREHQEHQDNGGEVVGFMLQSEKTIQKTESKVVTMPVDKRYTQDVKERNTKRQNNEYFQEQGKEVLEMLKNLG